MIAGSNNLEGTIQVKASEIVTKSPNDDNEDTDIDIDVNDDTSEQESDYGDCFDFLENPETILKEFSKAEELTSNFGSNSKGKKRITKFNLSKWTLTRNNFVIINKFKNVNLPICPSECFPR